VKAGSLALALLAFGRVAPAAPADSPANATVFVRVIGAVRTEYERAWKETVEKRDVEFATGSGFEIGRASCRERV